jgi:hypothetical protein
VKSIAALALLAAGAVFMPDADAQSVSIRIDTPELGVRIGPSVGYGVVDYPVAYPVPVYMPPVVVAPRPVAVYPAPVYLPPPPPRLIVAPSPRYAPVPVYYAPPHGRAYAPYPPPGHRKHKHHWKKHRDRYDD